MEIFFDCLVAYLYLSSTDFRLRLVENTCGNFSLTGLNSEIDWITLRLIFKACIKSYSHTKIQKNQTQEINSFNSNTNSDSGFRFHNFNNSSHKSKDVEM